MSEWPVGATVPWLLWLLRHVTMEVWLWTENNDTTPIDLYHGK